jgi:hypothetical protein
MEVYKKINRFFFFNSVNLRNIWEELAMTETRCPIYYRDGSLSYTLKQVKIAAVHIKVAVVTGDKCLLHHTYTEAPPVRFRRDFRNRKQF